MNAISAVTNTPTSNPITNLAGGNTHTIERGETLSQIAASNGVSVADLMAANPQIKNPDIIYPDDVLSIPNKSEPAQNEFASPALASINPANTVKAASTPATAKPAALQNIQNLQVPGATH